MPAVKNVGEPCAGEPHARFDGGREETSDSRQCRATPGASRLPDLLPSHAYDMQYATSVGTTSSRSGGKTRVTTVGEMSVGTSVNQCPNPRESPANGLNLRGVSRGVATRRNGLTMRDRRRAGY